MEQNSLLEKWLNNNLSEVEMETFQKSEEYPFYQKLIADASTFKASHFSQLSNFESLKQRLPKREVPVRKLNATTWILRIASVFVLGFALFYFFQFKPEVKIETLAGQKTTVELPDASLVTLNAMSEITYSAKKWKKNRSLTLKGEAFFDVAKGARFDVITDKGSVSVLGTEFNVKQREENFEVICFEGIVKVISGNFTEELRAGERLRLHKGELIRSKSAMEGPQWNSGVSDFIEFPFIEVIKELERQYNIEVILNEVSGESLFTGGFVHNDLENALRSVTEPFGLNFSISENQLVTISKREN
ncbi:MAG: FecR family protein [Eudoraea sp.]|nr:FecR family protein [Eudoraea sp.]